MPDFRSLSALAINTDPHHRHITDVRVANLPPLTENLAFAASLLNADSNGLWFHFLSSAFAYAICLTFVMPGLVTRSAEDRDVGRIKPPAWVHADGYDVVAVLAWCHPIFR